MSVAPVAQPADPRRRIATEFTALVRDQPEPHPGDWPGRAERHRLSAWWSLLVPSIERGRWPARRIPANTHGIAEAIETLLSGAGWADRYSRAARAAPVPPGYEGLVGGLARLADLAALAVVVDGANRAQRKDLRGVLVEVAAANPRLVPPANVSALNALLSHLLGSQTVSPALSPADNAAVGNAASVLAASPSPWTVVPGCSASYAVYDGQTQVTQGHTKLVLSLSSGINLKPGETAYGIARERLARTIDPRNWVSLSDAFAATFRVETVGGRPQTDAAGKPVLKPPPASHPLGGAPWQGVLYERVGIAWEETGADLAVFENYLNIKFEVGAAVRADYDLQESISSRVGTPWSTPGGIDVDRGFIEIRPTTAGDCPGLSQADRDRSITLHGIKNVRFTDRSPGDSRPTGPYDYGLELNYIAGALLCMWQTQIMARGAWLATA